MDHHVTLQYGPKYYVLVVQPPCFDRIDVKLAAVRVLLAMIRHRQQQSLVVLHLERLVLEMAAVYGFTTCSVPMRNVPTLDQKVGYCSGVCMLRSFLYCDVWWGENDKARQGMSEGLHEQWFCMNNGPAREDAATYFPTNQCFDPIYIMYDPLPQTIQPTKLLTYPMKFRPLVTQWLAAKLAIALVARAKSAKILYRTWSDAPEQSQHDLAAVMRFVLDLNVKIDSVGNFGQLSAMLQ